MLSTTQSPPGSGAVPGWLAASDDLECASENPEAEVRRQHTLACARIDKYFAWLMLAQWAAAIAIALWLSPGSSPYLCSLALVYGGLLTLVPVALTRIAPGEHLTRLTIAVTQMLMSSLLIHLSGGRMETHIFASLAFLAFYLDWQVLVAASVIIVADHLLRGIFLPGSVLGSTVLTSTTVQPWHWLELIGWILFCDIFLVAAVLDRLRNLRDLTTRHVGRGQQLYSAYHDDLTGLPNRASLTRKLTQAIAESQAGNAVFACLYLDLDRLKDVNDHFGHASGDTLLHLVARRIKARLGEHAFLARVGGDEFVALIAPPQPESSSGSSPSSSHRSIRAGEIARSLLRSLRPPFELDGNQIVVGASIGISLYPRDGQDPADLLTNCERAMYRVKRTGRNDVLVFTPAMFSDARDRERAERDLCVAIEERELQIHYQPIFHANGPVAGLEALLRWHHPTRGNIPPSEFIPLAEETGLIVQLGSFVLHEACRQASDWRNRGLLSGRIAVNVSSLELSREDYAESVILTLRQHYTPPDAIELEVTESALVHDFALAERHLGELRRYGIRISIDDFGTGYSALGRLRQLTLDTLKIDRLFVEGVAAAGPDHAPDHAPDRTVVQHIIAMAHTLHMTVVAEGVETESQRAILCALGCDQLQGFLLARPMNRQLAEDRLLLNAALPIEDAPLNDTCARA
jgi:diguanylate cyclase (GGDEF)-like protein